MYDRLEGYFQINKDVELFYQCWKKSQSKGVLLITHGLGEHSDAYQRFASGMNDSLWNIYAWDQRGHGRSSGQRGVINDYKNNIDDLHAFIQFVKNKENNPNKFVMLGHSNGGLITISYALSYGSEKIDAAVLSSPLLGINISVSSFKRIAARWLNRIAPSFTLCNNINYDDLTHDQMIIKSYKKDTLRHDRISPALFFGMLKYIDIVQNNAHSITLPLLLQIGGKDRIVSVKAEEEFFDKIQHSNKTKIIYTQSYHEIYNDLERQTAYSDIKNFLFELELKK